MILRSNRLNYKVCEVLYSAGVARELTEQSACLAVIARGLTHQVWYEFLTRHFIEEHPTEQIYDDLCKELGVTLTCNAWITRIKAQQGKLLAADICPSLFWLQKGIALPHET